jgi:multidrug efflux pump subunit AcrA (membrane-fusion protein)
MKLKISKKKLILGVAVISLVGAFFIYRNLSKNSQEVQYSTATAEKGSLVVSVSASGQISSLDTADITSKTSGDLAYLGAKVGQQVGTGQILAKIDQADAQDVIENAQTSLDQTNLDLQKMQGMETLVGSIRGVKEKAQDDLNTAYDDGFNTVSSIFLNLPDVMAGLYNTLFLNTYSTSQQNIDYYAKGIWGYYDPKSSVWRDAAYNNYQAAKSAYDKNLADYKTASRVSSQTDIDNLISETYETVRAVSDSVKSSANLIQYYKQILTDRSLTIPSAATSALASLNTYITQTNTYLSNILSAKNTIQSDKESLAETDYDIADQEAKVKDAQDVLNKAREALSDYTVVSPFGGTISAVDVENGDSVSSGRVLFAIITNQKIAEVSLNEVDATNVKVGQKATLIFDAIDNFSVVGQVYEVDSVGTVSQGVVNYGVKISFDSDDSRIKPGMSVTADIITNVKQDVLYITSSAIKTNGDAKYVQILKDGEVSTQEVQIGISNDTATEITSGLAEGDVVIKKISTSNSTVKTTTSNSSQGGGIPGGGIMQIMR